MKTIIRTWMGGQLSPLKTLTVDWEEASPCNWISQWQSDVRRSATIFT